MSAISVGQRLILTDAIWDNVEDHHPPSYIANKGDLVIVRSVSASGILGVAHEHVTDSSFAVYPGEYALTESDKKGESK